MRRELSQFLDYLEFERNRRPATINNHKSEINRFLDYLEEKNVELENVDNTFIRKYLRTQYEKKPKSTSMQTRISILKLFFRFCYRTGFIETDPAKDIICPLSSFLTEKVMEKFLPLPILALRDYALLELLYATGAFVSEIINIKINDIDFNDRRILIRGERWRKRYVFFGRKAEIALKSYLNVRPLLIKKEQ